MFKLNPLLFTFSFFEKNSLLCCVVIDVFSCVMRERRTVCCFIILRAQPLARFFLYVYIFLHIVASRLKYNNFLSRALAKNSRSDTRARFDFFFEVVLKLHAAKVFFLASRSASSVSFSSFANHGILVDAVEAGVALRHHAGWFCGTVIATSFALGR